MLKQHPFFVRPKRQKKESPTLSAELSFFLYSDMQFT